MKAFLNIFLAIILGMALGKMIGQTTFCSTCHTHTLEAPNGQCYFQSIPFDNIEQSITGKTVVFNSDAEILYEVPRYFDISANRKEAFLSNDGSIIAYVLDQAFEWGGVSHPSIALFKNGLPFKQFELSDLITCDSDQEDCYLFYAEVVDSIIWEKGEKQFIYQEQASDFQKQLTRKATFLHQDTLFIFTKSAELLKLDLHTATLSRVPLEQVDEAFFNQLSPVQLSAKAFKPISTYRFPALNDGQPIETALAEYLDMRVFPEDHKRSSKYRKHSIHLEILVDSSGNAVMDKLVNYDDLPTAKINSFIESTRFQTSEVPPETGVWRFDGFIGLMNKNKNEAKKERKLEKIAERKAYEQRLVADSINGFYIPQDIEACFEELNQRLRSKDIETIKNLASRDDLARYHLGLGMWLRNNWGLWGGSRLQTYMTERGISHPDMMSGSILRFYYDWLHGEHDAWRAFDQKE